MEKTFWIMLGLATLAAAVTFLADYNNDRKSKNTIIIGYACTMGMVIIAAIFYSSLPAWIPGSITAIAIVLCGRYLVRQIVNRKF